MVVPREELSDRQKQVAAQLAAGLRVAGIAEQLCIAEVTVRNHLRSIFDKLDIHSQPDLIDLLRREPELLGAHRRIDGASEPGLADELAQVDRLAEMRIEEAFANHQGLDAIRAVFRAVLPLDDQRRREWRTRLAVHAVAPQQRDVRDLFGEVRRKWQSRPLARIAHLQQEGWLRQDLDPDDVRHRLVSAVHGAAMALIADPSPAEERRQLALIDELLDSMIAEDARNEGFSRGDVGGAG
jgi:DNA-binding CsgD family transcriptional regulator